MGAPSANAGSVANGKNTTAEERSKNFFMSRFLSPLCAVLAF
jgi:hypothetical protein